MTINCKGNLIDLTTPKVMGILNVTPDSFYDGGRYETEKSILNQASKLLEDGADFIDIGGYSSRPGADHISVEEELNRTIPIIELLLDHYPDCLISIDTFRSQVAEAAVRSGAAMVNDISAGQLDQDMIPLVGELQVPYIMMHMRGTPQNMKEKTNYNSLMRDILYYFSERISTAREHRIHDLIIDPGFGFAKNLDQNYEILAKLEHLKICELPVLVGVSRKSMIYKPLGSKAEDALNGTSVLNTIALMKGASILRVHDVKEAVECIKLYNLLKSQE